MTPAELRALADEADQWCDGSHTACADLWTAVRVFTDTYEADLRERLAAAIERNCLSDAFLDPDDPDNAYKVCRYCFAAARIVRSRP